ncbi:hypothetical protein BDI24065_04051 [Burkholderia diffusa]|uniref:Uncharacterized protein n=1 Tax=Burkholderia diffusa TaxID=488732 RepID=A0A6P2MPK8_9BURK|nr:hypothetical protein BDI24065_04051 [Burkholderia diffusa]
MDKYDCFVAREDEVRGAGQTADMQSVAKTPLVQCLTDNQLGFCIFTPNT